MSELVVPVEAIQALVAATEPKTEAGPLDVVRAISSPVAAAELRRLADLMAGDEPYYSLLRTRANELDGGTR